MFFYEGQSCPVCNKPFAPDEDIVSCPRCGLPHHRHCWQVTGHCHMEALHGTEQQWSRDTKPNAVSPAESRDSSTEQALPKRQCHHCGGSNPEYAEFCQHCGRPMAAEEWNSQSNPWYAQRPYYEYSPQSYRVAEQPTDDERIDEVPVAHLSALVGVKQEYYIPRFCQLAANGSGGWNWAAFLCGPYWFLYRRMYLPGIFLLVIRTVYTLLGSLALTRMGITDPYVDVIDVVNMSANERFCLLSIVILTGIMILISVLTGAMANRIYKQACVSRAKKAMEQVADISPSELAQGGGISFSVVAIAYCVTNVVTQLLALLFLQ